MHHVIWDVISYSLAYIIFHRAIKHLKCNALITGVKPACIIPCSLSPFLYYSSAAFKSQNKMSYHRNNKNKNSWECILYPCSERCCQNCLTECTSHGRPTHGSYNKADVNKRPNSNLCSGESPHLHRLLIHVCDLHPCEMSWWSN